MPQRYIGSYRPARLPLGARGERIRAALGHLYGRSVMTGVRGAGHPLHPAAFVPDAGESVGWPGRASPRLPATIVLNPTARPACTPRLPAPLLTDRHTAVSRGRRQPRFRVMPAGGGNARPTVHGSGQLPGKRCPQPRVAPSSGTRRSSSAPANGLVRASPSRCHSVRSVGGLPCLIGPSEPSSSGPADTPGYDGQTTSPSRTTSDSASQDSWKRIHPSRTVPSASRCASPAPAASQLSRAPVSSN